MNKSQNFDIRLDEIIPEYYSKNKYIKSIFFKRLEIAISYLDEIKAKKVLDAGCGDGLFTSMLNNNRICNEIVAVDFNVHTEELNKKYKNIKFIRRDLSGLDFQKEFDAITCLDVLEHFENAAVVLKNIKNSLKENGYLIVSGPIESFWYKLGRFITKGTFSQETGPGAGKHFYNIIELDELIKQDFYLTKKKKVNFFGIHLFDVNLYKK